MWTTRSRHEAACRDDEAGLGLVELLVSTTILSVGLLGLMTAMGMSLKYVGVAQQRQTASAVGQALLEEIRGVGYDRVALPSVPVPAAGTPDAALGAGGTLYNVGSTDEGCDMLAAGSCEAVVVDPDGLVDHVRTESSGPTTVRTYVYVSWVDDPDVSGTADYKRVTVIAVWSRSQAHGVIDHVKLQTFLGTGRIAFPSPSAPPPPLPAAPSASPQPSSAVEAVSCPGDVTAPAGSLTILTSAGAVTGIRTPHRSRWNSSRRTRARRSRSSSLRTGRSGERRS